MKRRELLKQMGSVGAAGAMGVLMAGGQQARAAAKGIDRPATGANIRGPYIDLTTGVGNKIGYTRTQSDLDPGKQKHGWFKGYVMAVRPDKATQDIFGFEGLSTSRVKVLEDGSFLKLLREVGLYTDLKTGEVMESWHNPFLDEEVKVVPIANDPFNFVYTEFEQGSPMNAGRPHGEGPFLLPWQQRGGRLDLETHVHLRYPNLLDPEKWPRESSGPFVVASEFMAMHCSAADMQNPDLTSVRVHGTWNRTSPWLPWMLMGPTPGFCMYSTFFGIGDDLEQVHSQQLLDYVEKNYPQYFEAPKDWDGGPNRSSLENYVQEQKPAPVK